MSVSSREMNAAIKKEFKTRPGYVRVSCSMVGSFPCVGFHGDISVKLAYDIARWVEENFPGFVKPFGQNTSHHINANMDGNTIINWF